MKSGFTEKEWYNAIVFKDTNLFHDMAIRRAWERCFDTGIDPYLKKCRTVIKSNELKKRKLENGDLMKHADLMVAHLSNTWPINKYAISIIDKELFVLAIYGEKPLLDKLSNEYNLVPGTNMAEYSVGCSAVSVCHVEKVPFTMKGYEHYCMVFHGCSMTAAPIYLPSGSEIGILVLSTWGDTHPDVVSIVSNMAKLIEYGLEIETLKTQIQNREIYYEVLMDQIDSGVLIVDEQGKIIKYNQKACHILGDKGELIRGKDIREEIKFSPLIYDVLLKEKTYKKKRFDVKNNRGKEFTIQLTASPVKNNSGRTIGAVNLIKEIAEQYSHSPNKISSAKYTFDDIITRSPSLKECISLAKNFAASSSIILICGESGTGKELFAQAIHNASPNQSEPFVAVNCAAIPRDLMESELFGYEEGAFTGARKGGYPGKLEQAGQGTIFLDEVGDMPLEMQGKLLRVLQERNFYRVCGSKIIELKSRVLAATNRNLLEEIEKGRFRRDLYYRLNALAIELPPLRSRKMDMPLLVDFILKKLGTKAGRKNISGVSDEVMEMFYSYSWPGNVRQLENVLERAINITAGDVITTKDLPDYLRESEHSVHAIDANSIKLREYEKKVILSVLKNFDGNVSKAAIYLGVSRATMYNKLKKFNISRK